MWRSRCSAVKVHGKYLRGKILKNIQISFLYLKIMASVKNIITGFTLINVLIIFRLIAQRYSVKTRFLNVCCR